jgi:hypothetical protein
MLDGLRAVECPSHIIDVIGGWATTGIGKRYSFGHSLDVKAWWLEKIM